jgi:hypothetical protein
VASEYFQSLNNNFVDSKVTIDSDEKFNLTADQLSSSPFSNVKLDKEGVFDEVADSLSESPLKTDPPYSFPSTRGSAFAVYNSLANISFVPGSFGGMSASIAYIRYWSRKGTEQRTEVNTSTETANSGSQSGTTPSAEIAKEVEKNSKTTAKPSITLESSGNNPFGGRPRQPVPVTPVNKARTEDQQTTEAGERTEKPQKPDFFEKLRKLFSANPGAVSKSAPLYQNPFYKLAPDAPDPVGQGVWRFLFNPEELQLSSGPDYNRSETWGVSDPKNEGQALSWRANKNRKLTFSKVLLHGYSFGKRVDSLEKGLQDLFMARDGENGADGPPVLEFVWGNRVFGPCVIQNIQVREKAWDKGILVNAEVSFELEQVPEWTINDGFVDVLRPGRQPLVNDPIAPPAATQDGGDGGGNEPPSDTTPPPGRTPNGGNNTQNKKKCGIILRYWLLINQDVVRFNGTETGYANTNELLQIIKNKVNYFQVHFNELYDKYPGLQSYIEGKLKGQDRQCRRSEFNDALYNPRYGFFRNISSAETTPSNADTLKVFNHTKGKNSAKKCAEILVKELEQYYKKGKPGDDPCRSNRIAAQTREFNEKCSKLNNGEASCVGSGQGAVSKNCGGKEYVCDGTVWIPKPNQ